MNSELINIHLYSKHAKKNESIYEFDIENVLSFVNKKVYLTITDFQALNTIFNVNETNNEFMGNILPEGHYRVSNILPIIQATLKEKSILNANSIEFFFDETRLEFGFKSISPFTLSGTVLNFLNIFTTTSTLIDDLYYLKSSQPVDLFKSSHNIHICSKNILITESNLKEEVSSIAKIAINCNYGEFIIYESEKNSIEIFNDFLSSFSICLKNDLNEDVIKNTNFSLTLRFQVFNQELSKTNLKSAEIIGGGLYPVINRYTSILKDARQLSIERYDEKMKTYLTNHPMYNFTEKEIRKMKKKKLNLIEELMKKNNKFLM